MITFLMFFILMPFLYTSASDSKGSPKHAIHSKSTGEIPSLLSSMATCSEALDIPKRPEHHARKRSNSEKEIFLPDEWASPPSSSTNRTSWISPSLNRSSSQQRLSMGSKQKKRSCKELNENDEKIWREQRSRLPRLQRSSSVPSNMNEQHQLLADSVTVASSTRLLARVAHSQEQTQKKLNEAMQQLKEDAKTLQQFTSRISHLSIKLEGLFNQHATLLSAHEGTTNDIQALIRRIEVLEKHPASTAEHTNTKSSHKEKRPRSNALLSFSFNNHQKE